MTPLNIKVVILEIFWTVICEQFYLTRSFYWEIDTKIHCNRDATDLQGSNKEICLFRSWIWAYQGKRASPAFLNSYSWCVYLFFFLTARKSSLTFGSPVAVLKNCIVYSSWDWFYLSIFIVSLPNSQVFVLYILCIYILYMFVYLCIYKYMWVMCMSVCVCPLTPSSYLQND